MKKYLIGLIFLMMLFGAVFFGKVIVRKPYALMGAISEMFSVRSVIDEQTKLRKENADLRAQLLAATLGYVLPQRQSLMEAKVFSVNPFNVKNRIFIDKGSRDGVTKGAPVLFSDSVLLGYVGRINESQSEVVTVFDPAFSLAVRIGENEIDGLLEGGVNPRVGLIDRQKDVRASDSVYAASSQVPYGLLIGFVQEVAVDDSNAFLQASLELPYALLDVRDVFIVRTL